MHQQAQSTSPLITLQNVTIRKFNSTILTDINWTIGQLEHWVIVGSNGSGKTTLAEAIMGRHSIAEGQRVYHFNTLTEFSPNGAIELVSNDSAFFNQLTHASEHYYQQRFNASDAENSLLTIEFLTQAFHTTAEALTTEEAQRIEEVATLLRIEGLLNRRLIKLSNGETRRTLLAQALLKKPLLLILDNPFIGLDIKARAELKTIINKLIASGTHIVLVAEQEDIPDGITHVLQLEAGHVTGLFDRQTFITRIASGPSVDPLQVDLSSNPLAQNDAIQAQTTFHTAIRMQNVTVAYAGVQIVENVSWTVNKGEKWALLGPNGSGKSTLLSLVTGDNPQAYANHIELFDRRRGSGESIWDIKKRIGYVSPELHLYYTAFATCEQVVASGHFDSIGLHRRCSAEQMESAKKYLAMLGINYLEQKTFTRISTGEQRLVLLARALVKNPPLLIYGRTLPRP